MSTATRFMAVLCERRRRGTPMRRISHARVTPNCSMHAPAHLLAQRLEIGGRSGAGVDQEVAVLLRDHGAAARAARGSRRRRSAPRPPCASGSGWRRSSRRCACASAGSSSRLVWISCMRAAMACGASPAARAVRPTGRSSPRARRSGDRRSRARRGVRWCTLPGRVDRLGARRSRPSSRRRRRRAFMRRAPPMVPGMPDRNSRPAMPASRAASATLRSSAPAPARTRGAVDGDIGEAAAQADDDAGHAAVAHQQVGADADHGDGHVRRLGGEEGDEVVAVGRAEHHLRRAADAEPGDARRAARSRSAARAPAAAARSDALRSHRRRHHRASLARCGVELRAARPAARAPSR